MAMSPAEIADAYDAIADRVWESPSLYRDALALARDVHGNVLDIGCGQGRFLEMLAAKKKARSLWGCDISPKLIELAKARVPKADLRVANALDLKGYPSNAFDFVFMIGSLEHMIEHEQALREAARVLKRGGSLIVAVPNASWINYEKWKIHRTEFQPVDDYWFKPEELIGLMQKVGLRVTKVRGLWALYRGNWIHQLEMLTAFFIRPLHRKMKLIGVRARK